MPVPSRDHAGLKAASVGAMLGVTYRIFDAQSDADVQVAGTVAIRCVFGGFIPWPDVSNATKSFVGPVVAGETSGRSPSSSHGVSRRTSLPFGPMRKIAIVLSR